MKITYKKIFLCARNLAHRLGFNDLYFNKGDMHDDWEKTDEYKERHSHVFAKGGLPLYNGTAATVQVPNVYISDGRDGAVHLVCTMESDGRRRLNGFVIRFRNGNIYEAGIMDGRTRVGEKELTETLEELLS